jgi:hypothetical protein
MLTERSKSVSLFKLVTVAVSVSKVFKAVVIGTLTTIAIPTPVPVLSGASDPILHVTTWPLTPHAVPCVGIAEHP